ncbi:MAG TPA: succinate dehydrogenase/fumarate reductase iron-sulfur subunit [Polyangiaceae bacterium]
MSRRLNLVLHIWRQENASSPGRFERYEAKDIDDHMSFLEMLDVVNERLQASGQRPVAFDHDCREGICGMCGVMINGQAHGPIPNTTTCQLHMRHFNNGDEITIEPFRATAFPVLRDLVIDRSAYDRIIQAGGYISVRAGSAPEANSVRVPKPDADLAMDAAQCIGCGACAAACPNAAASLFTASKVSHLALLPQGQIERADRVRKMVAQMDAEGFGHCTNHGECERACPKGIDLGFIARMNRELLTAGVGARNEVAARAPRK